MKPTPVIDNFNLAPVVLCFVALLLIGCSGDQQPAAMKMTDYPDHETPAAQMYIARCGECHAAPRPDKYPADRWPGVVQRMVMRMNNKAIQPPNREQMALIMGYLQKHASE
jgi:hypothetical protein